MPPRPLAPPRVTAVRRPIPIALSPLVLIAALGALAWWGPWSTHSVTPIAFHAHGPRTKGPICLAVMIDESGSMSDSDPQQSRSAALIGAASFLGSEGVPQDRIAGGWFADQARVSTLMDGPTGLRHLPRSSTVSSGGGTNMAAAVTTAAQVLGQCDAATRPVLALVSDGMADDFEAVAQSLTHLPANTEVHLLAIDATGSLGQAPDWQNLGPNVQVNAVRSLDRKGVGSGMALLLSDLTGQQVAVASGHTPGTSTSTTPHG